MQNAQDTFQSYSWHQSHDQATVLLLVPYETSEDEIAVVFDRNYLIAGVRGQPPTVQGRLYGHVDVTNSVWQLEPRTSRLTARERTTSTTSTTSTHSSFAFVSETEATELSSGLAASTENGFFSEFDESLSSPALSSPVSLAAEDFSGFPLNSAPRRRPRFTTSHPVSPHPTAASLSLASSFSSLESLHGTSGRLLTIHVEKAESMIWPSLIVGPVPEALSSCIPVSYPWPSTSATEARYNMDPTSLALLGLDLFDIRDEKEEAFEYFVRAWHQAHSPSASMRIASYYLPITAILPDAQSAELAPSSTTPTSDTRSPLSPQATPTVPHSTPYIDSQPTTSIGRSAYYLQRLGGPEALSQVYLEVGLLFLEGSASGLLTSSYAGLSSLRTPIQSQNRPSSHDYSSPGGVGSSPNEAWRRDQDYAKRYFNRARQLYPDLDVPLLPHSDPSSDHERSATPSSHNSGSEPQFRMPSIDVSASQELPESQPRRRRRKETLSATASTTSAVEERTAAPDQDNTWYLYLPGLVGAGTALLIVGFLSFSSWRKGQGS